MTSVLEDMLQAIDRSQKYWPRGFENVNNAHAPYFSLEGLNAQKSSWLSLLALVELTSLCQLAFDLLRSVVKSEITWNELKRTTSIIDAAYYVVGRIVPAATSCSHPPEPTHIATRMTTPTRGRPVRTKASFDLMGHMFSFCWAFVLTGFRSTIGRSHLHRMIMSVFKEVIRHCLQLPFLQRPWGDAYCGSPCQFCRRFSLKLKLSCFAT